MLHLLKRHPFPIQAHFEHCLVLAYAFPADALEELLPPGLALDTYHSVGFVAAAFVQTRQLRPAAIPACCGSNFFLAGYRVFVKHRIPAGRTLRGLRILRSDADKRAMVWGGNMLTHYNYHLCNATVSTADRLLSIRVRTPGALADVDITAHIAEPDAPLPIESPFADEREARRFQGPLPYTFDYESRTNSIIRIKAMRPCWSPRLVRVDVRQLGFLNQGLLARHTPKLASAFHVADVSYRWERGVVERLAGDAA